MNEGAGRIGYVHCGYCESGIPEPPITLVIKGMTLYACCPNCERDLIKGRGIIST